MIDRLVPNVHQLQREPLALHRAAQRLQPRRADPVAEEREGAQLLAAPRPALYEGALSFGTTMCSSNRDSPYKQEWGWQNDRRPSSKPAPPSPPAGRGACSARASAAAPASASLL